jgi:hypothetical protein
MLREIANRTRPLLTLSHSCPVGRTKHTVVITELILINLTQLRFYNYLRRSCIEQSMKISCFPSTETWQLLQRSDNLFSMYLRNQSAPIKLSSWSSFEVELAEKELLIELLSEIQPLTVFFQHFSCSTM